MLRSIPFRSQFELLNDSRGQVYLKYTEDAGLKMNKGGLKHRNVECKMVEVYCISDISRCPVRLFIKYLSMLPKLESHRLCICSQGSDSLLVTGI